MTRQTQTMTPGYFAGMYEADPDSWRFATSDYEREKYTATLAALGRDRYRAALEIGCSIGVFTRRLATRCDALLAVDVATVALDRARRDLADLQNVRFELAVVPKSWPMGVFDLIVLSEVAYYLARPDLVQLVACVEASSATGAEIILVHWLGETDYPLTGDEAASVFIAESARFAVPVRQSRTQRYRLDLLRAGTTA